MERWLYLAINLLSVAFPLAASFEQRLRFYRHWKGLFTGIAVMMVIFIPWDAAFTERGIWGFNARHTLGIDLFGLPIEEWLFFICIPYSCVYLHEVMRYSIKREPFSKTARPLAIGAAIALLVIGGMYTHRLYTSITFIGCGALLFLHGAVLKSAWLGRFWMGYAISLVPFFLVNGILTGWLLPEPIVWYNNTENLGIRMNTIPVEDSIYLLFFLLIVIGFHERGRAKSKSLRSDQGRS
ncbi:MAG: lycopene cyclase domain-containing protein [Flavobacteriales bacterium]|nr:lycopene cyclase domain-containing protein [Flavobacteriales bacterium]